MYIVIFFILFLAVLVYLFFEKPLKVGFLLDSDEMKMMAAVTWLKIFKAELKIVDTKPQISIYIKSKRIYSQSVKKAKKKDMSSFRALSLKDTKVNIFYGLIRPDINGMLYAVLKFIGSLTDSVEVEQYPEYFPENEYLRIEADTNVNIGNSIVNLIKQKLESNKRRERRWISHI